MTYQMTCGPVSYTHLNSRPCTAASAVGIAQAALDEAVPYAKERVVFGKPIWKHEGIGFLRADMEIQTQAARQMVWGACKSADAGIINKKLIASAKCFAGDTAVFVTTNAVQAVSYTHLDVYKRQILSSWLRMSICSTPQR